MLPLHNEQNSILGLTKDTRIGRTNSTTYTPAQMVKLNIVEKLFHQNCHLPTRFDLMPCEDWLYPKFFTYTNINKYMFLYTHSFEFNIKFFLNQLATIDWKFTEIDLENIFEEDVIRDKYSLQNPEEVDFDTVFFLPGSNLDYVIDYGKISQVMATNDEAYIKPHPLTSMEHKSILGNMFGWDRIIESNISGHLVMGQTKNVFYTDNSEIGFKAMLMGKNVQDFNVSTLCQPMVYHPFYHILRTCGEDANFLINAFFNTSKFGMFNLETSTDTLKNDIVSYLHDLEAFRKRFKPEATVFDDKEFQRLLTIKKEAKKNADLQTS